MNELDFYEDKADELEDLEKCANGTPYFLILQSSEDDISMRIKEKFNIRLIFDAIMQLIECYPQKQSEFSDYIIELSKKLNNNGL